MFISPSPQLYSIIAALALDPLLIKEIDEEMHRRFGKVYRTILKDYGMSAIEFRSYFSSTQGPDNILSEEEVLKSNDDLVKGMFSLLIRSIAQGKDLGKLPLIKRKAFKSFYGSTPLVLSKTFDDVDLGKHKLGNEVLNVSVNNDIQSSDGCLDLSDRLLTMFIDGFTLKYADGQIMSSMRYQKDIPCIVTPHTKEKLIFLEYNLYMGLQLKVVKGEDGYYPDVQITYYRRIRNQIIRFIRLQPLEIKQLNYSFEFNVRCHYIEF